MSSPVKLWGAKICLYQLELEMSMYLCDRKIVRDFLAEQLQEDERLDFLFHLDNCPHCWEAVYNGTKAAHPHFYKRASGKAKLSEAELKKLGIESDVKEEVFEVA